MAKMGRPKIPIDKNDFEKLCAMQCTLVEIAGFFDCSEDTIENWCKSEYEGLTFSEVFKKKSAKGKISVRRNQFRAADAGNVSMLIWLGKQYLGQKDYNEVELHESVDDTIKEMDNYFAKQKRNNGDAME